MAHAEQAAALTCASKVNHIAPPICVGGPWGIGKVAGRLASPEAAWVNGQVVRANGGIGQERKE